MGWYPILLVFSVASLLSGASVSALSLEHGLGPLKLRIVEESRRAGGDIFPISSLPNSLHMSLAPTAAGTYAKRTVNHVPRDDLDPLGFLDGGSHTPKVSVEAHQPATKSTTSSEQHLSSGSATSLSQTGSSSSTTLSSTRTSPSFSLASDKATIGSAVSSSQSSMLITTPTPSSSISTFSSSHSVSTSGGPDQWETIGIAVIAIVTIASVILGVIFFDQWWNRFLRPLICRRGKRDSRLEEMIPDWDARSWRVAVDEKNDRHSQAFSHESELIPPFPPRVLVSVPLPGSRTPIDSVGYVPYHEGMAAPAYLAPSPPAAPLSRSMSNASKRSYVNVHEEPVLSNEDAYCIEPSHSGNPFEGPYVS